MHKNAKLTPAGRALLVRRVREDGQSVAVVAAAMGVSERTARKWIGRYEAEGSAGLADRSSRPHRSPGQLKPALVRRIEKLRRRKWTAQQIADALDLAISTVGLWLRRLGLGRLKVLEPRPVVIRYEKKRPGELLHLDTKKLGRIQGVGHRIHGDRQRRARGVGWEFLHVCVDDATRVAYAEVLGDERAVTATASPPFSNPWRGFPTTAPPARRPPSSISIPSWSNSTRARTAWSTSSRPRSKWAWANSSSTSPPPTG